jgi:hypothetical protein
MRSSFEKPNTKASLLSTMVTSTSSGTSSDNTVASSRPAMPAPSMSTLFIESPFRRESAPFARSDPELPLKSRMGDLGMS